MVDLLRIADKIDQSSALWKLAGRQHGLITRLQLLAHGIEAGAITRRLAAGRLHQVLSGVYAVGRPQLTLEGRWMAAVLACGPEAVLSHGSAAALWGIRPTRKGLVDVSVPLCVRRRHRGIVVHRRQVLTDDDVTRHNGIPVTTPICTLIDIAAQLEPALVEAAVNEADMRGLTDAERLRLALDGCGRRPGVRALREILDRPAFALTDSELERRFLKLACEIGLAKPETGVWLNGFKVDFYWRGLGLVVETDGLRYHRTPAQQTRDRVRDQAHLEGGLLPLRFTHHQVKFEPDHVRKVLRTVVQRISAERGLIAE